MRMSFNATVLMLPGIGNSGERHWQTYWEREYPQFIRVQQRDWETPRCRDWVSTLEKTLMPYDESSIIVVAHSAACAMVAHWAYQYKRKIKGALLVAPADSEAPSFPPGTTGFNPIPLIRFPFPSIVVASTNDEYVDIERAILFSQMWGSEIIEIGEAGHINPGTGFGEWKEGLELLKRLDVGKESFVNE